MAVSVIDFASNLDDLPEQNFNGAFEAYTSNLQTN